MTLPSTLMKSDAPATRLTFDAADVYAMLSDSGVIDEA